MKVSFTGTQEGMTAYQKLSLERFLKLHKPSALIHGGCIGADDQADEIAAFLGIDRFVFPSDKLEKRVPDNTLKSRMGSKVVIMPEKPPLARNPDIIRAGDLLVAAPRQREMVVRSGTWATVRHARKRGVKIEILEP